MTRNRKMVQKNNRFSALKWGVVIFASLVLLSALSYQVFVPDLATAEPVEKLFRGSRVKQVEGGGMLYLPAAFHKAQFESPLMLGVVADGFWVRYNTDVQDKLKTLDAWTGKKHTVVGYYYDFVTETNSRSQVEYNFRGQLENLWDNGYVSYVKLGAGEASMYDIAAGVYDAKIHLLASQYKKFVDQGDGRKAFIAPLHEMNGYWLTYGEDIGNFKIAYDRIRSIFTSEGVDASQIWWAFSPNGWSRDGFEFEKFYPGDDKVDVVAFSAYNFAFCNTETDYMPRWDQYDVVFKPYVDRLMAMAPTKPIIVSEMSTSAQYPRTGVFNTAMKNQWLIDSYNFLANQPNVIAVMYFDLDTAASEECDYAIFNGPTQYGGYQAAARNRKYEYYLPSELSNMLLFVGP